jgi:hypothetical protein
LIKKFGEHKTVIKITLISSIKSELLIWGIKSEYFGEEKS